jgi:hypothetical protein
MKTVSFTREFYSNIPGWEVDLYKSGDINGSWTSLRECMIAALQADGYEPIVDWEFFDEAALDEICLSRNIYVLVEDV